MAAAYKKYAYHIISINIYSWNFSIYTYSAAKKIETQQHWVLYKSHNRYVHIACDTVSCNTETKLWIQLTYLYIK